VKALCEPLPEERMVAELEEEKPAQGSLF